jgi:hypothetical protein
MLIIALLALQAAPAPEPYRPPVSTIVAEPVALYIAFADQDRDGRTTLPELRKTVLETTSADPPWQAAGQAGIGYIQYADWAQRWLGDRNALPSPFEVDRNGDNRISVDEFESRMEAIFARVDSDRDGAVTRAELLTIRGAPRGDRPEGRRGGGDGGDRPRRRR